VSIFVSLIIFTIYVRFGYRSVNFEIFSSSQVRQNLGGAVVAGTCRPYMSSLNYCIQTKYWNKQSLLWNLCVLLTYIFLLLRIVKFYMNNYSGTQKKTIVGLLYSILSERYCDFFLNRPVTSVLCIVATTYHIFLFCSLWTCFRMPALRLISSFPDSINWFIEDHAFSPSYDLTPPPPSSPPPVSKLDWRYTERLTGNKLLTGAGVGQEPNHTLWSVPIVSYLSCQLIAMKPELVGTLLHCVIESLVVEATLLWARYNRFKSTF